MPSPSVKCRLLDINLQSITEALVLKKQWIEINGAILSCLFPQISSPLLFLPAIYKNSPGETEGLVRESMHDTIKFLSETEI